MRKGLVMIGSVITGLGAVGFWIAQNWIVRYEPWSDIPVHPEQEYSILALLIILAGVIIAIYGAISTKGEEKKEGV